ncbi:MAG: alpha/beta fold hydrolase [Armatimonadota bacterium]
MNPSSDIVPSRLQPASNHSPAFEGRGGPARWHYDRHTGHRPTVLLPGWATDARIFARLSLPGDIIRPAGLLTGNIDSLVEFLKENGCAPVTLLGWSLGGFAAADFARRHPALVERVVLVGIRRQYPAERIEEMRQALRQDRARCLAGFYRQCFLPAQREDYRRFRAALEPDYLAEFTEAELLEGLQYLGSVTLEPEALPPGVTIVHGALDIIAPPAEACRLAEDAGIGLNLLPGVGHAAFLAEEFPWLSS